MFPTIYGIALEGWGEDIKFGSAGLVMAILSGALLPLVQGAVIDTVGTAFSNVMPTAAFLVVTGYELFDFAAAPRGRAIWPDWACDWRWSRWVSSAGAGPPVLYLTAAMTAGLLMRCASAAGTRHEGSNSARGRREEAKSHLDRSPTLSPPNGSLALLVSQV